MTSKEAVETLNKYRNQNYNSTDKDEVELANAINVILPKYVKQEKLLELYKELSKLKDDVIHLVMFEKDYEHLRVKTVKIEQQIKELEKELEK